MPPELVATAETVVLTRPLADSRPLLTIAVPTFGRAEQLTTLLEVLRPQLAGVPEVELLISDNASPDRTPEVVRQAAERFRAAGARIRTFRQPVNLGADANFAFCFREASGRFFWMCGDDDLIVPGAVSEVLELLRTPSGEPATLDLLYATSYGFREDFRSERGSDPLGRQVHTIQNAHTLAQVVNIMFTFISGIIVNKDRLEAIGFEPPENFVGTNLVQLSWSLPLLLQHRRSVVLWTRPVAARVGSAHGYSLGRVFGKQLVEVVGRLLPNRPDLSGPILDVTLRRWLPSVLLEARSKESDRLRLEEAHGELQEAFGRNWRYWVFTYPALRLPVPSARLYTRLTAAFCKVLYAVQVPGFWRKRS